jgi:hypothetical protein
VDASVDRDLQAKALEARVNRVARELAVETGRPVRAWLSDVAYTLARGFDHEIIEVDGMPTFVVRLPGRASREEPPGDAGPRPD